MHFLNSTRRRRRRKNCVFRENNLYFLPTSLLSPIGLSNLRDNLTLVVRYHTMRFTGIWLYICRIWINFKIKDFNFYIFFLSCWKKYREIAIWWLYWFSPEVVSEFIILRFWSDLCREISTKSYFTNSFIENDGLDDYFRYSYVDSKTSNFPPIRLNVVRIYR